MSHIREQKQRIEDIATARYITGTLRDISAIELGKLMQRFGTNFTFYTELTDLYRLVWRMARERDKEQPEREKKTLYVAYTTNRHFYGALNYNTMQLFMKSTGTEDRCLIIGDTGKRYWLSNAKKRKALEYMSFLDDTPSDDENKAFLDRIARYDKVIVFYPKFVSVFTQEASMVDITFQPDGHTSKDVDDEDGAEFLLEPELDEMMAFFDQQVRSALFERILLETQLSRISARLVRMDSADQNAQKLLRREGRALRKAYTNIASRQMLETLVGYIQWHNKNKQPIVQ